MATVRPGIRDYVLGNSPREQERLKRQASIVGGWTEQYFLAAGLDRGMRVLDLGCGMGDVSLLAAAIVGPSGSVTAIDRDSEVIEKARQRATGEGCRAPIAFAQVDLLDFHSDSQFDAVVGRFFLLYQPDPVIAVRKAAEQVRSGGIVCFHEMAFGHPVRSYPANTLFERMYSLVGEIFRRAGAEPDIGLQLTRCFLSAGLSRPSLKADVPIGGEAGSYLYGWAAETLRTLLPKIQQLGLASAEEIQIDTLAARMEEEAVELQSQLIGAIQFGAWTRKT